jgi:hypothetical protein
VYEIKVNGVSIYATLLQSVLLFITIYYDYLQVEIYLLDIILLTIDPLLFGYYIPSWITIVTGSSDS